MEIEDLQAIAANLKGTTEDIKWQNHLCFNIGGKMYCIIGLDTHPTTASFKVSDEDFEFWSNQEGFIPAPYLARNKWIFCHDISLLSKNQWTALLSNAHAIIKSKLTKKVQKEIEESK